MLRLFRSLLSFVMVGATLGLVQCATLRSAIDRFSGPIPLHERLYIPETFSAEETEAIINAANEWQTTTNGFISFDIILHFDGNTDALGVQDDVIAFQDLSFDDPRVIEEDEGYRNQHLAIMTLGFYDSSGMVPTISMIPSRINGTEMYREIVLHELGHSIISSEHNPSPGTVMYYLLSSGSDHITHSDLVEMCKVRNCDPDHLKKD